MCAFQRTEGSLQPGDLPVTGGGSALRFQGQEVVRVITRQA